MPEFLSHIFTRTSNPHSTTTQPSHRFEGFTEDGRVVLRDCRGTKKAEIPNVDLKSETRDARLQRNRRYRSRLRLVGIPLLSDIQRSLRLQRNHMGNWEVILQLGAEGGSVTLYGMQTERGWLFSRNVSDWTPELIGEERIQHKSPVVDSWEAAVALLGQYPWQRLSPLMVHPEFSERIWSAVRDRLERDQASGRYLDSWRNKCKGGDDSL